VITRRGALALAALGGVTPPRADQRQANTAVGTVLPAPNNLLINPVIVVTPGKGVFVYSPSPGLGNLVASFAPANGTDRYGNAFLGGVTSYAASGGGYVAMGFNNGRQQGFTNATYGGAYSAYFEINANLAIPEVFLTSTGLLGLVGTQTIIATTPASAIGADLLEVQGNIAADGGIAIVGGVYEAWHAFSLAAGFTAGSPVPSYKVLLQQNKVTLTGFVDFAAGFTGAKQFSSVSGVYVPASDQFVFAINQTGAFMYVSVLTSGAVFANAAPAGTTAFYFNGDYPTDL
jgi:hypothetical protein